ncbi:MAG TPA: sugar ABC transporter permease [bacterium]|nr:sugar ABC transporter permease [bacterium]
MTKQTRSKAIGRATADLKRPLALIVLFLLPAVLLYLVFFVYPMGQAIRLSLFRGSAAAERFEYVGSENIAKLLLEDASFWRALWHNVQFIFVGGTATLVLALSLAVGLTWCGRGRDFFRIVFLFPNVMSVVAVSILWSFVFNPSFGLLNGLLRLMRLEQFCRAWLGEPATALWAVMLIYVWCATGFYVVLFYAGLLRIPKDYVEAAQIDGANFWQQFRHISLPLLSEILKIAAVYIVINSVNIFSLVFVINEGQPSRYNDVLLTYLYQQGFQNGNFGYACAIGVMILITVLVFAVAVNRLFRQEPVEL